MTNKVIENHMKNLFEELLYGCHVRTPEQEESLTKIVKIENEIKEKYPDAWTLFRKLDDLQSSYTAKQERIVFELTTHLNKAFLPLMNVDFKNLGGGKKWIN